MYNIIIEFRRECHKLIYFTQILSHTDLNNIRYRDVIIGNRYI